MEPETMVHVLMHGTTAEDSSLIDAAVQRITREMGEVDVVVANAGICYHVDADVREKTPSMVFKKKKRKSSLSWLIS